MENTIWTKEELESIRKDFFNKNTMFKIEKEDEQEKLVIKKDKGANYYKTITPLYMDTQDEILSLFYIQDDTKIFNVINKLKNIKYDKNNEEHYGIVKALATLNKENEIINTINENIKNAKYVKGIQEEKINRAQIFIIFKEIVATFNKGIYNFAANYIKNFDPNNINEIFENINNNSIEINKELNDYLNSLYKNVEDIVEDELYVPVMKKLNEKALLLFCNACHMQINNILRINYHQKKEIINNYSKSISTRYLKSK